jgi:hypothetical protein
LNRYLREFWDQISDNNGNLICGDSVGKIRQWNDKCPNPTCEANTRHCSRCRAEYGIWVCGTTCKGHHIFDRINHFLRLIVKDDVRHSRIHWNDMGDDEIERVFNINDKEIRKRGWFDARR